MLLAAMCFWETTTTTFHMPCRKITLTLFDIVAIVGFRPTGETLEPSTPTKTKHVFEFEKTACNTFIKDHCALIESLGDHKHVNFLTYWLSHYVFCFRSFQVDKYFVSLASQLHEKRSVCLNKLIFCGLYKYLGLTSHELKQRKKSVKSPGSQPHLAPVIVA